MNPIVWLILSVLDIYSYVVIIAVVASWLVAFDVVNPYNGFMRSLLGVLRALTEPVFGFVRRVLPPIAGLDLSPLVVLFAVMFLKQAVIWGYNRMPYLY